MDKNILVVDDEKLIVKGIRFSLEQEDMKVDVAYDGEEALKLAKENKYSLILLDVMLPKIDGLRVCQMIREFSNTPIIMVTAKGDELDKIMGLEYGADDYLTKPFNILELKARIKAILRRSIQKVNNVPIVSPILKIRELSINTDSRCAYIDLRQINLTAKEFDILEFLMKNTGKIYTRENLLKEVWGSDNPSEARSIDVHIRRLREKVEENPKEPQFIHTKWGVGYYFQ